METGWSGGRCDVRERRGNLVTSLEIALPFDSSCSLRVRCSWRYSSTRVSQARRNCMCESKSPSSSCADANAKKALLTSGDMAGLLCPPAVRTLPLPSPILSPSRFPYSGRYKRGMASELRALQQPGLEY
eukprot:scaffold1883_cov108-Isochrysis_galbana.AAC.10